MDRLTERDECGNAELINLYTFTLCYDELKLDEQNILCEALHKLAAYEDLNLTPSEISTALSDLKRVTTERDRAIKDIRTAASQGECMVCKNPRWFQLCHECDNGKDAFEWRGLAAGE